MSAVADDVHPADAASDATGERDLLDALVPILLHWRLLLVAPLLAGLVALGATYLVAPTYTSRTTFLPPQQQQSSAVSALAQLTALSGLAAATGAVKTPGELTLPIVRALVGDILLVEEDAIEDAILTLLEVEKTVIEGAGAAGLAAVRAYR